MERKEGGKKWQIPNQQGFIPGPKEIEEEFLKRIEFCLNLKGELSNALLPPGEKLSIEEEEEILLPSLERTSYLYDICPRFPPIFFSNWRLAPWHGASAWIFQVSDDAPLGALIQVRKALSKKRRYLGLYDREELLTHELCHVGRMAFEEKKYEELLAFRTSKRFFSRYLGPLLQSAQESHLFLFVLIAIFLLDLFFILQGAYSIYFETMWLKLIPLGLIAYAFFRLRRRQKKLEKTLLKLKSLYGEKGEAILYRLRDSEIELFPSLSSEEIAAYIHRQRCFRWEVIRLCYPFISQGKNG